MDFIDHRSTAQFTFLTSATDEKIRINADGDLLVGISTPFDTSGITLDATGALGVDGHITVATGATYDIGTATNKFRDLYLSGDINVAGVSTSGDLTVGGSLSVTTDATVTGSLTVSTDATITNDLTVSNDATISGDLTVSTNAVIAGDLTVNGTTTTINTETLDVKDKNITLNYGGDTTSANGAGITIEDAVSAGNDATILWDGSNDTFDFSHAIDVTGTISGDNNLSIQNSNAYGSIEVGGVSGGFIDIKRPFSDDYDLRLIAEGDGGVINVASGELTIQRAGSAKFATSSSGVDVTGDIAVSGTVDGRDVATDGLKLDGIEASADVTDTTNVTAAGALMDSEVTNLDQVKAFDSSDYATAAQGSTADSALQNVVEDTTPQLGGDLDLNGNNITGTGNIDVTGTVTADGLTVQNGSNAGITFDLTTNYSPVIKPTQPVSDLYLEAVGGGGFKVSTTSNDRLLIQNNGDISFYEDTGTTAKLFWDASTEFLGLGSTSPQAKLDIVDTSSDVQMRVYKNDGTKNTRITVTADDSGAKIHYRDADNAGALRFNNNLGEVMRIPADTTRVGIGTSSPSARLDVQQATAGNIVSAEFDNTDYTANNRNAIKIRQQVSSSGSYSAYLGSDKNTGNLFLANDSITANHLVINPSGNVGIGRVSNSVVRLSVAGTDAGASNYAFEATNSSAATRFIVRNDGQSQFFKSDNSASMTVTSGGNVGIGTSSPSGLLNVHSASGDANVFITTGTTNASTTLLFGDSGSSTIGRVQYDHSDNSMRFQTNASEAMRIDSAGRAGIGTSSPTAGLECINTEGAIVARSTQSSNTNVSLRFAGGAYSGNKATAILLDGVSGENNLYLGGGTNFGEPATDIRFHTGSAGAVGTGTERMRIDSSGNVGIGVTPSASHYKCLEIGNAGSNITGRGAADTHFMSGLFWDGQSTQEYAVSSVAVGKYQITNGIHYWATAPAGTAGNTATVQTNMMLDVSGNLLVGTTTTNFNTAGTVLYGANGVQMVRSNATPLNLNRTTSDGAIQEFYKDGTTVGSIFNSGTTMGIGSLDTGVLLANNIDAILPWNASTNAERDAAIDLGRSSGRFKDLHLSGTAYVATSIGIGTSSPSANLEITQSGNNVGLLVAGGGYNYTAKFESSDAEANIIIEDSNSTNDGNMIGVVTNDMYFITNTSERMRIDSSGNVGINTSSPTSVQGFAKVLKLEDSSNASIVVSGGSHEAEYAVSSSGGWFGTSTNIPQRFITNNTERMRIDSTGRVGLGTNSPDVKLDIVDTAADVQLRVYKFDGTNNTRLTLTADDSGAKIHYRDATNGGALRFNNNAGEMARFDASSNLLVGTTAPHPAGNNTAGMSVGTGIGLSVQGANTALTIGVPSAQTYGMAFRFQGALAGRIGIEANNITVADVSDYRLKENVAPLSDALTKIKALKPSSFNFINYPDKTHEGFIAHELQEVIPYAVSGEKDALITEATKDRGTVGEIDPQAVDLRKLVPTLVAAIQELSAQVESLTARIEALES